MGQAFLPPAPIRDAIVARACMTGRAFTSMDVHVGGTKRNRVTSFTTRPVAGNMGVELLL